MPDQPSKPGSGRTTGSHCSLAHASSRTRYEGTRRRAWRTSRFGSRSRRAAPACVRVSSYAAGSKGRRFRRSWERQSRMRRLWRLAMGSPIRIPVSLQWWLSACRASAYCIKPSCGQRVSSVPGACGEASNGSEVKIRSHCDGNWRQFDEYWGEIMPRTYGKSGAIAVQ